MSAASPETTAAPRRAAETTGGVASAPLARSMGALGAVPLPLLFAGLAVAIVASVVVSVGIGAVPIPAGEVARILLHDLTNGLLGGRADWSPTDEEIVWSFRAPRVLLAVVVGAGLAVAGTTMQAVVRNPLADPYILGVSEGAALGAAVVVVLGVAAVGGLPLSVAAFLGALGAFGLVYLFSQQGGRVTPARLVLAGVALSYLFSSGTSFLVLKAESAQGNGAQAILFWLMGSLASADWTSLGLPAAAVLVTVAILLTQARGLNAILLGEESAVGLGIDVQRLRLLSVSVAALLTGTVVAVSGGIGFVGLMIPHITRLLVGADHRRVLPAAALTGGLFLLWVDTAARTVLAPDELPLSIITAIIGTPFFLWLMRRKGQGASA